MILYFFLIGLLCYYHLVESVGMVLLFNPNDQWAFINLNTTLHIYQNTYKPKERYNKFLLYLRWKMKVLVSHRGFTVCNNRKYGMLCISLANVVVVALDRYGEYV